MKINKLAIDGGLPVRENFLQYGKQSITENDINRVQNVLRSDFLTSGPNVTKFEEDLSEFCGTKYAVTLNSGTAALHGMYSSVGLSVDDEVIVPAITFAATANAAIYCGAKPVLADIDPETMLVDSGDIESKITTKTKIITGVDYAGQIADYDEIKKIKNSIDKNINVFADAAHSFGAFQSNRKSGSIADASSFSFHPVKGITTGEGGAVTTDNQMIYKKIKQFRNHGISTEFQERNRNNTWEYDIPEIGYNYRLSDIHAALGSSQITSVDSKINIRRNIAKNYDIAIKNINGITSLKTLTKNIHSYHIYVVIIDLNQFKVDRNQFFLALRSENIGVNVHYIPLYEHTFFKNFGFIQSDYPNSRYIYDRIITLPLWPDMSEYDINSVIEALKKVAKAYKR